MERITKAATVTATTDLGEFTAIAAAYSVDRVGDRIIYGAFAKTIAHWQQSGKRVPLHWDHRGEAANIIGSLDPSTMQEIKGTGLQVSGQVDLQDSDTAREAWRAMKGGSMSLSFGYLVTRETKAADGANDLLEIDLFEVSIVPAPANPDTRILSMKSGAELREDSERLAREVTDARLAEDVPPAPAAEPAAPEPTVEQQLVKQLQEVTERLGQTEQALADLQKKAEETDKEPDPARSVDPLRKRSEELALELSSGGMSLRTPPAPVKAPARDLPDPEETKRKSRDLMFEVLSYSTE